MKKRRRLWIGLIAVALIAAIALVAWGYGEQIQQIYDKCAVAWIDRAARNNVGHLGTIDEVEICSLGGEPAPDDRDPFEGDGLHGVIARKVVHGADAEAIASLWRTLPMGRDYQAMCFEPAYGLRFRRGGKVVLKSSVCWHCQALTFPAPPLGTIEYGFNAQSESAQKLLNLLQTHVPLPVSAAKGTEK
jgi:hypothetical protein